MSGDELSCVLLLEILVLDLDVNHLRTVQLLQFLDLLPQFPILGLHRPHLLLITVTQGLVVRQLILELAVLVVVGTLQLANLVLQQQDLIRVVLL